jgi:predicted cupin superfamily sugar epimerase
MSELPPAAEEIIRRLALQPHPEGGYYAETYRASGTIPHSALPKKFAGDRNWSTAIYCLYPRGTVSKLHRIAADEVWHHYAGGPLTLVEIDRAGRPRKTVLGPNVAAGQRPQHVVPAGVWFGGYPNPESDFCLAGATVAPGFDFAEFELADRTALLEIYPRAREEIMRLT